MVLEIIMAGLIIIFSIYVCGMVGDYITWGSDSGMFVGGFVGLLIGAAFSSLLFIPSNRCSCEDKCCNHKVCCEEGHKKCLEKEQTKGQTKKQKDSSEKESIVIVDDDYKFYLEGEEVNGNKMDLDRYHKKVDEKKKEIYLTPKYGEDAYD